MTLACFGGSLQAASRRRMPGIGDAQPRGQPRHVHAEGPPDQAVGRDVVADDPPPARPAVVAPIPA